MRPTEDRSEPPASWTRARWDRETERRYAALELAVRGNAGRTSQCPSEEIVEVAKDFYRFLTEHRGKPPEEE